jgi:hypothetical protein
MLSVLTATKYLAHADKGWITARPNEYARANDNVLTSLRFQSKVHDNLAVQNSQRKEHADN